MISDLAASVGSLPHVLLRDTEPVDESDRGSRSSSSPEIPTLADRPARLQLFGEIARGGMGAILRGRDVDLGRELAVKVLLESNQGHPEVVRRFIEEAQIGGQLQHPGIVPVYELGAFADRRPYFAMKLVKGQTLAIARWPSADATRAAQALLPGEKSALTRGRGSDDESDEVSSPHPLPTERGTSPTSPRFLPIFEQVCQTMAYAHARGVIHRDLKPSNVMVGAFGEVQVMDWGLAKVLRQGDAADGVEPEHETESAISTVRSGSSDGASLAGSVLGTPSYMAPEQARGELDQVDERADVFGLGAILCEILTGQPPFVGQTREEIREKAARGDVADAFHRLDTCGADPELLSLARDCLAPDRQQRPRDAMQVAARMTAHLAGVQDRLRAAELARVEAQARAEEERKRRRLTVALAASVMGLVVLGGGGWTYLQRQRLREVSRANQALSQVEFLYADARRAGDELPRWIDARNAARAVERLMADVRDEATIRRIAALVRNVTQDAAAAENDQTLLTNLIDIPSAKGDDPDGMATESNYADAFLEAGLDVDALSPIEVGTKIRSRPSTLRVAIGAALDDWAAVRRVLRGDRVGAQRLTEIARLADPDPWRNRLREVLQFSSNPERLSKLQDLAKSAKIDELPPVSLGLIGGALLQVGDAPGRKSCSARPNGAILPISGSTTPLPRAWNGLGGTRKRSGTTWRPGQSDPRQCTSWPTPSRRRGR